MLNRNADKGNVGCFEIMLQDQSDRINEAIFFEEFGKRIGDQTLRKLEPMFEEYYRTEFSILKKGMDDNENMIEAISLLKEKGYRLIIATNPMFPKVAVSKRIEYSGLMKMTLNLCQTILFILHVNHL